MQFSTDALRTADRRPHGGFEARDKVSRRYQPDDGLLVMAAGVDEGADRKGHKRGHL